ncbi:MAG TPA: Rieske (2Fe-2S) protein [Bryobacteraceae bacterium]|jgi:menaquinol-cytochrome c reductase iron-sulfur subunit|nr:Rieske (2Fe-2S) protein [Bryobacteraceae bacterium]
MSTQNAVHPHGGTEGQTRRTFQLVVLNLLGALIGAALVLPTLVYLLIPPKSRKSGSWIDAGDISTVTPDAPVELSFQKTRLDGWRLVTEKKTAWVVREANNKIVAFGPACTHLGCAYHWEASAKQFVCPCHNSFFSLDGKVTAGPAPRPLDQYVTKIENNRLQVGDLKRSDA